MSKKTGGTPTKTPAKGNTRPTQPAKSDWGRKSDRGSSYGSNDNTVSESKPIPDKPGKK